MSRTSEAMMLDLIERQHERIEALERSVANLHEVLFGKLTVTETTGTWKPHPPYVAPIFDPITPQEKAEAAIARLPDHAPPPPKQRICFDCAQEKGLRLTSQPQWNEGTCSFCGKPQLTVSTAKVR